MIKWHRYKQIDHWNRMKVQTDSHSYRNSVRDKSSILFFFKFIFLFWERERTWAGEDQRDRERERIPSRVCAISPKSDMGIDPMNCKIMTWAEIESRMLNWLSHPGTPKKQHFKSVGKDSFWWVGETPVNSFRRSTLEPCFIPYTERNLTQIKRLNAKNKIIKKEWDTISFWVCNRSIKNLKIWKRKMVVQYNKDDSIFLEIYVSEFLCVCVCVHTCVSVYVSKCVCLCECVYVGESIWVFVWVYEWVNVCMWWVWMCMCVVVGVCMWVNENMSECVCMSLYEYVSEHV